MHSDEIVMTKGKDTSGGGGIETKSCNLKAALSMHGFG